MPEIKPIKINSSGALEEIGATDTIPASALPVSVITPSQITSDQDNYNPTGFSTATVVRLSGDNGFRAITGFSAGTDGQEITFINVGSFPIYFPGEHPDSTAANRINVPYDFILFPKMRTRAIYDGTAARWVFSVADMPGKFPKSLQYDVSAGSATGGDWGEIGFTAVGSGTISFAGSNGGNPLGLASFQVSTTTLSTNGGIVYFLKSGIPYGGYSKNYSFARYVFSFSNLSSSTERYWANFSLTPTIASGTQHPNNSIGIRYSDDTNSGKFELYSVDNSGSITTLDSGVTVNANELYDFFVFIDKSNSEARYYINGSYVGRITSGLPTNTAFFGSRAIITKSVGTTARIMYVYRIEAAAINP